jgi:hypothetical protein
VRNRTVSGAEQWKTECERDHHKEEEIREEIQNQIAVGW